LLDAYLQIFTLVIILLVGHIYLQLSYLPRSKGKGTSTLRR
jgi:hypothetical protein